MPGLVVACITINGKDLRKITKEMILKVVNKEVDVLIFETSQNDSVDLYFGKVEKTCMLVVVNRETYTIVTVRNLRKNEKKIYDKEFEL